MRTIDADAFIENVNSGLYVYLQANSQDVIDAVNDEPTLNCKTCKYYHPYYEQFSNVPRGDGYCVIARMTPEGMTTINCNDEFSCSDYQKANEKGATW